MWQSALLALCQWQKPFFKKRLRKLTWNCKISEVGGKEAQEGGNICILRANSCGTAETNTTL